MCLCFNPQHKDVANTIAALVKQHTALEEQVKTLQELVEALKKASIEDIIKAKSAGMTDAQKSAYASQIDQINYDLLLKVDLHLVEITAEQWKAAVKEQYPGLKTMELPDAVLKTVRITELQSVLSKDWTNLCKYIADFWDCDKFSDLLVARLEKYYGITAIREVWGQTSGGYHAFCIGAIYDGDKLIARLIEPQTDDIFIDNGPLGSYHPEFLK